MNFLGALVLVAFLALIAVPPALLLSASITHADRRVLSRWLSVAGFVWLFLGFGALVFVVGQSASS